MKTIAFDRKVCNVLKQFVESSGETVKDSVLQSVLDYVNILSHVCGDNPNPELAHIVNSFEIKAQVIFKKMRELRKDYLRLRKHEAILTDRKLPHCDNQNYVRISLPDELYNGISVLIHRYPNVFTNEKKATIKDVVNRAILFRVMENEQLMNNEIYRAWRLKSLMQREQDSKLPIDGILEIVSKKRRVIWNDK